MIGKNIVIQVIQKTYLYLEYFNGRVIMGIIQIYGVKYL